MMSDEKRFYHQYAEELIRLYKDFDNNFEKNALDYELADNVFELLRIKKVDINDLAAYVEKEKDKLSKLVVPENGLLFQQPVSLLINYYFDKHKTFLRDNWTLNNESLKDVYSVNNESFESY